MKSSFYEICSINDRVFRDRQEHRASCHQTQEHLQMSHMEYVSDLDFLPVPVNECVFRILRTIDIHSSDLSSQAQDDPEQVEQL
jgi:hypothetical protein